jgi:hypothetical protein
MTTYTRATQIADIARAFEAAGHVVQQIVYWADGENIDVYTDSRMCFEYEMGSDDDDMVFTCLHSDPADNLTVTVTPSIED